MQVSKLDTITAIATPPGKGGVGIIRVSGAMVSLVMERLLKRASLQPRYAHYLGFHDANDLLIDSGIVLFFPAPYSFTGEDVLELQCHGSPVVLDQLLRRLQALGARLARPGEFSERAFLNGKIDLVQAEAIADLIDSTTTAAARSAQLSLQGVFSERINELVESLIQSRMYIEAAIDFVDEDIDFLSDGAIATKLESVLTQLDEVVQRAQQGRVLRDGLSVVIAGKPNAGKSSLLNCLAGHDAAIVSEIPGTTRDVLREQIQIDGMPLHVIDTAGLRDSADPIEQEGIRRASQAMALADHILLITDSREALALNVAPGEIPAHKTITLIHNKIDLSGEPARSSTPTDRTEIWLSAKTGAGVDLLRQHLKACAGYHSESGETLFIARRRHLEALEKARVAMVNAIRQSHLGPHSAAELLAEDLRLAHNALAEITGAYSNEDLLSRVFSSFCIGK